MSFAKLFSSITESSLWSEPNEVRILFVTMLAKADSTGFVDASLPGLARVANLTLDETTRAILVLESPDPHSKDLAQNPDNEGRRILKVPGGWMMINYEAYRERRGDEERREYMREYMRAYREARKLPVNSGKPPLAKAEKEKERDPEKDRKPEKEPLGGTDPPDNGFAAFWSAYPRKTAKLKAEGAWVKAIAVAPAADITGAIEAHKQSRQWKDNNGAFIPHASTWLNQRRWEDQIDAPPAPTDYSKGFWTTPPPSQRDKPTV